MARAVAVSGLGGPMSRRKWKRRLPIELQSALGLSNKRQIERQADEPRRNEQ